MDNSNVVNERLQKLEKLKALLSDVDNKLLNLTEQLNWNYEKLLEENPSNMVTCSINKHHKIPISKIEVHKQKCFLHSEGYSEEDKFFSEHSGMGSFIKLTPESLHSITLNVPSSREEKSLRNVPQTSANFDQNFNREEKLAIYDYVIANTQNQKSFSDLWMQPSAKTVEEKKEKTIWELAAAERDAKRRRASYRNKVHTNRKTHTEILREVIESQMEAFKEEIISEKQEEKTEKQNKRSRKFSHESDRVRHHESSSRRSKEDRDKRRSHDNHSKHREHKRSPSNTGSDIKSRSRSHDKYRKWKTYEGRSHSHRSSHSHRR